MVVQKVNGFFFVYYFQMNKEKNRTNEERESSQSGKDSTRKSESFGVRKRLFANWKLTASFSILNFVYHRIFPLWSPILIYDAPTSSNQWNVQIRRHGYVLYLRQEFITRFSVSAWQPSSSRRCICLAGKPSKFDGFVKKGVNMTG